MNVKIAFRSAVSLGLLLSTTACYTVRPLDVPVPPMATRIVASLTDSGTVAMGNAIGPGAVEVEGVVVKADDQEWQLSLLRVDHRDGRSINWNREPVSFPRQALSAPAVRRLDKTRSWLAAGVLTAAVVIAAGVFRLVGADEPIPVDPIPAN